MRSTFLDHHDQPIATQPALASLDRACTRAVTQQIERQLQGVDGASHVGGELGDVSVAPLPADGVSIAYLIMGHRRFAHATIARLVRVLWGPSHLFLIHLDAKTNTTAANYLRDRYVSKPNVHLMRRQRSVGWGAFSMIEVLLDALSAALTVAPNFDFFINLSDADVALRTSTELGGFLSQFRGRSFVAVKFPDADAMRYHAHAHMRTFTWLECEGEGFVVLNQTAGSFFGGEGRRCCYARSGPIVYSEQPIERPPAPDGWQFYHGSQWALLARNAVEWLVHEPKVASLARHMRLTYMADETFLQTALMASPLRGSLVNHNLRYIDWPHGYGDPNAYWRSLGAQHAAGPMILTPELFASVTGSSVRACNASTHLRDRARAYGRRGGRLIDSAVGTYPSLIPCPPIPPLTMRVCGLCSRRHRRRLRARWTSSSKTALTSCVAGTRGWAPNSS